MIKSKHSQIAKELTSIFSHLNNNSINNQKCLGIIIQDISRDTEMMISLVLREMSL